MSNRSKDLSGEYVLISDHFFYFGDNPRPLPKHLVALAQNTRGHRSRLNDELFLPFLEWLKKSRFTPNKLYGVPQVDLFAGSAERCSTA